MSPFYTIPTKNRYNYQLAIAFFRTFLISMSSRASKAS